MADQEIPDRLHSICLAHMTRNFYKMIVHRITMRGNLPSNGVEYFLFCLTASSIFDNRHAPFKKFDDRKRLDYSGNTCH